MCLCIHFFLHCRVWLKDLKHSWDICGFLSFLSIQTNTLDTICHLTVPYMCNLLTCLYIIGYFRYIIYRIKVLRIIKYCRYGFICDSFDSHILKRKYSVIDKRFLTEIVFLIGKKYI